MWKLKSPMIINLSFIGKYRESRFSNSEKKVDIVYLFILDDSGLYIVIHVILLAFKLIVVSIISIEVTMG